MGFEPMTYRLRIDGIFEFLHRYAYAREEIPR